MLNTTVKVTALSIRALLAGAAIIAAAGLVAATPAFAAEGKQTNSAKLGKPLKEAHDQVTMLESEIREEVPEVESILTHIESEPATIETGDEILRDANLEKRLKAIAAEFPEILDMHDIQIKRVRGRRYVSCHCTMSDELPLSRVHDIQTELEIRFKQEAPELFRVLIHPEPSTDNRR